VGVKQPVRAQNHLTHEDGRQAANAHWDDTERRADPDMHPAEVAHGRFTFRSMLRAGNPIPGQARSSTSSKQFKQLRIGE
jgi:hypothetical protein